MWKTVIESEVGNLTAFADAQGLAALLWPNVDLSRFEATVAETVRPTEIPLFTDLAQQLSEYFQGSRRQFELPLNPNGTEFQRAAWQALTQIPFGQTRTYAQQAAAIGRPKAVRAVGAANGKNPISIVVPCHRVIGKNGSLTGFAGGIEVKRRLLELESQPT